MGIGPNSALLRRREEWSSWSTDLVNGRVDAVGSYRSGRYVVARFMAESLLVAGIPEVVERRRARRDGFAVNRGSASARRDPERCATFRSASQCVAV
jgi:hypothetical protein